MRPLACSQHHRDGNMQGPMGTAVPGSLCLFASLTSSCFGELVEKQFQTVITLSFLELHFFFSPSLFLSHTVLYSLLLQISYAIVELFLTLLVET